VQIHLSSLGCRLNEAELLQWAGEFRAAGHQIVRNPAEADIFVLNTCAVTQEAVRKSRKSIQRLQRQNPNAKVVVSGCYTTLSSESEHAALGIDLVVHNNDKDSLARDVEQKLGNRSMPQSATLPTSSAIFERSRQRAFIKIQDGCRYRCTYCIVTLARGAERSRLMSEIVNEVNHLGDGGVQEIVLTGVHVGGYGGDLNSDLFSLVTTLLRETDIPRIRFASVEPWDLPENFFSLFEDTRLMPHMHLPVQSGCDTVLKRMSRRCKTAEFRALVETARQAVPDFNVTTDIIVGFPGETEQEWQETMAFSRSIGFGHIHVFPYSVREGTKAASLPDQIHGRIKKHRSQELHALASIQKRQTLTASLHRDQLVLFESAKAVLDGTGEQIANRYVGYTPNYCKVAIETPLDLRLDNAICLTSLNALEDDACISGSLRKVVSQKQQNAPDKYPMRQSVNNPPALLNTINRKIVPIAPR